MTRSLILLTLLMVTQESQGDVITREFELENEGVISGNTLIISDTFTENGVTFTAEFTATGSGNFDQNGNGIGVVGNGSNLINASEFVQFTLELSNISGGLVTFDGFTEIDLDSFEDSEVAAISSDSVFDDPGDVILDSSEPSDIFPISPLLSEFFVVSNGVGSNTFRVRDITAQFTTTAAVPEPSSIAFLSVASIGVATLRRKRAKALANDGAA